MVLIASGWSGSAPRTEAVMSSGVTAIGSTRPWAPSSRATQSRPSTWSPSSSQSVTISRLPTAWLCISPALTNRCCRTRAQVRPQSSSPHSADNAWRRSPGGSTPNSRRSRPDEPPLSATVTTAVSSLTTRRSAARDAASPCPPPSATTRASTDHAGCAAWVTSLPPQVTVHRSGSETERSQARGDLFGHRDAPVLPTRAADGHRHEALALLQIPHGHRFQQRHVLVEKHLRLGSVLDVVGDLLVASGQWPQLRDPVRIGKEPHVRHQISINRDAVLKAETHYRRLQRGRPLGAEGLRDLVRELVHVQPTGVDDQVGVRSELGQRDPLAPESVEQAPPFLQRVRSAGSFLAADQHVVVGFQEQQRAPSTRGPPSEPLLESAEERPGAHVDDDSDRLHRSPALVDESDHVGDELRRHVVDDVVTEVFELLGRGAAAGTGHAGDDHHLTAVVEPGRLLGDAVHHAGHHDSSLLVSSSVEMLVSSSVEMLVSSSVEMISPVAVFTLTVGRPCCCRSRSAATIASAVRVPMPGTSAISSTVAARSRLRDPTRLSRLLRRTSPSPATSSRRLSTMV